MEAPVTPKRPRPSLTRSHNAHATTTPPDKTTVGPGAAKRTHHLKPLRTHNVYRRHHRDDDKGGVQSATLLQAPRLFGDSSSPVTRTVGHLRPASRTVSRVDTRGQLDGNALAIARSRSVRPEEVMKERVRAAERHDALRGSLNNLSDLAQMATRNLDNAWYNILEKVATLRSVIASLQDLSAANKKLHEDFNDNTDGLKRDVLSQIDAFGSFAVQEQHIEELEQRVQRGIQRATHLSERLEHARKRVNQWETRERQWQAKTTRRLRILWTVIAVAIALMVFLMCIPDRFLAHHNEEIVMPSKAIPDFASSILAEAMAGKTLQADHTDLLPQENISLDSRLRVFDEL